MIQSFLMIGQSNMAGRGFLDEVPLIFDEHIKMLRNGRWQTMAEPVNYDRPTAGGSLGVSFAAAWRVGNPAGEIGLIPCADGGTSLDDWAVGGPLFENAVNQARLALQSSTLAGILWHQGESDCFPEKAALYEGKFAAIMTALRDALQAPEVPLVIGGLGDYLTTGIYGAYFKLYTEVNAVLRRIAQTQPHCTFAAATGLTANPDGLHFNAASLRTLGVRYYKAWAEQAGIAVAKEEQEILEEIYARPFTPAEQIKLLENQFAAGKLSAADFTAQHTTLREQV